MKVGPRIYKHPDGRWEARYRKGRRADGSILYGSAYGRTCEEAEKRRAEILRDLALHAEQGDSVDVIAISESNRGIREYYTAVPKARTVYPVPFDEQEMAELLPNANRLRENLRLAFYLALYMGVSGEELAALRYADIDFSNRTLHISCYMTDAKHMLGLIVPCETRTVPIPEIIWKNFNGSARSPEQSGAYLLTESDAPIKSLRAAKSLWTKLTAVYGTEKKVTPEVLRATFIRRCLEGGMNVETVARMTGLPVFALRSRYGQYAAANPMLLNCMAFSTDGKKKEPRQMNLLIFGAGSHGHAVYEIAEKLGIFQKISFLDDRVTGEHVIGKIEDCLQYIDEYPLCFIAIGNNEKRRSLAELVTAAGFITPRLISAETSIAKGVSIGRGSIIMPQATVNTGAKIGDFCIVASNALIGFNASVESFSHCDCASVIMKDCVVHEMKTVESGEIVKEKREAVG